MYLGHCIDKKLSRTEHINNLSTQLAKYGVMLYQICRFVNEHNFKILHYAFTCSCVQYEILVRGTFDLY